MNKNALLLLLLAAAPAVAAEDAAPANTGPFRPGWYVTPMLTYMKADTARCAVDDGFGGTLAFGHRGDFASIELWGQFLSVPKGECSYTVPDSGNPPQNPDGDSDNARDPVTEPAGDVSLNGAGLGLVVGPFFEDEIFSRIFGVIGFGMIRREDHPQYAQGDSTIFGDAGLGYLQPFELFGLDWGARLEARYRYDVQQPPHPTPEEQDPPPAHAYSDVIVNLGLQLALSGKPPPPQAAAEPVAVVAVADTDGDGVPDETDKCPGTATGTQVDEGGCEPPAPPPAAVTLETARAGDTIVLHGVNFETARATLTSNARTILDGVAEKLVQRAELRIEIGGHTDARGSDSYNQDLSERRAQSVIAYLSERGVDPGRLSAVGYGEAQPVADNESDEGREKNRRVELKVIE